MNKRLQQFLSAENISQAQFADTIDVARASVSHVLAGRNKPGYDFIKSISDHYPKLNLDWLINGKGKMYKETAVTAGIPQSHEDIEDCLFKDDPEDDSLTAQVSTASNTPAGPAPSHISAASPVHDSQTPVLPEQQINNKQRSITKIVVFYDDNTYQELV